VNQQRDVRTDAEGRRDLDDSGAPRRIPAIEAARGAVEQLTSLLGIEPERVIGVEARDGAWRVRLEVVELKRIPETTSMMASYDVDVGLDGDLIGYRRTHHYARGQMEGR
jgi:Gas vesicle synthesis protein GvpO